MVRLPWSRAVGAPVSISSSRFLLTLELDVVYATGDDDIDMTLPTGGAALWGGGTFSYTW
jgi:hypothetical protein